MKWVLPGLVALLNEVFFPLLGVLGRLPVCFVMYEVLLVLIDLLKPLDSMEVDGLVISVQGLLACDHGAHLRVPKL